jgi:BASS family bile acid:Na+ symporter
MMKTTILIKLLNVTALVIMMLSIGMKVSFQQVLASARDIRAVVSSILANFVLVPLITVGLLYGLDAPALASAGFLILAVCPGAPVGPPFAAIARGDVSLATGLMVILAASSALLAPGILALLIGWLSPQSDLHINYVDIAATLLVTQILPLGVGLGIHERAPRLTGSLVKPVSLLANLLLLGVVALILATQYQTLKAFRLRGWVGMFALLLASLGAGWLCGGPARVGRRTLAMTTGVRNVAVGLVIVSANFAGTPAVTAVVAYGLVSILGTLACALFFRRFDRSLSSSFTGRLEGLLGR